MFTIQLFRQPRRISSGVLALMIGASSAVIPVFGQTAAAVPEGLVAWWKGESNGVDVVSGASGYETNGAGYGPGEVGSGFSLDGVDDRVLAPNSPAMNFGPNQDFSIETWIQAFPTPGNYLGFTAIFDKTLTPDASSAVGWMLFMQNGYLGFLMSAAPMSVGGSSWWVAFQPNLQDGKFHHVAVTVERTTATGGKMYVDGNMVSTFDPRQESGDLSNTEPLHIGNHANPSLNCFFKGIIDEVSIYDQALTAAEIQAIVAAGAAGKANPVIDDGIPAEWREKYFGPNYALNPQAAATADPDQDGANNYQEYLAGTDPLNAKSVFRTPTYVSTYAGSVPGGMDGYVTNATFYSPNSITLDRWGRYWLTECTMAGWEANGRGGHRVRLLTNDIVTTIAGSDEPGLVDGPGLTARFRGPNFPVLDTLANVFVADRSNHRIRKIAPNGLVSTFAGSTAGFLNGTGTNAQFHSPIGLVIDRDNNLYTTDFDNICVRKITPDGIVTTFAGTGERGRQDGPRESATFDSPNSLAITADGTLYVTDWLNGSLRKIGTNGLVSTLATGFAYAETVSLDASGNILMTSAGSRIASISPSGQVLWSVTFGQGYQDGPISTAKFQVIGSPLHMPDGNILVVDINNNRLRIIHQTVPPVLSLTPASGTEVPVLLRIGTVVTNGVIYFTTDDSDPTVNSPRYTNAVSITNNCIVKVRVFVNGYPVSDIASATYVASFPDDGIPAEWRIQYFGPNSQSDPRLAATADPDQDGANNFQEYLAGTDPMNPQSVFRTPTYVSTYAGSVPGGVDGYVTNATFFTPDSLGIDPLGRYWVTESYIIGWEPGQNGGNRVRMITNHTVITIAGSDEPGLVEGPGLTARFRGPTSPTFDSLGNVFICDRGNHRIRKISPDGLVSTFAGSTAGFTDGTGRNARLHTPIGLVIDKFNNLYVGDFDNICVRKVTPEGVVTTYAGTGQRGSQDGPRQSATFNSPSGLAIAGDGTIYVADWVNGMVRKIDTNGVVSTVAHGYWYPERLALDPLGNILVARDSGRYATLITPEGQLIWSLHWGQGYRDGPVSTAKFQVMSSPLYLLDGNILVTDISNNRLRIVHQTVPPLLSLSPASGTAVPVTLEISTVVTNGVIYFTTDDSDPTVNSPRYTNAVSITNNCTVKARVYVNGYPVSDIASATYVASFPDDGIPNDWREFYFGPGYRTDPRVAAGADPDGDGSINLAEYLAGTDPLDPQSVLKISNVRMVPVVNWSSVSNKLYRVLRLDDINSDEWILLNPLVRATNSSSTFTDYSATNSKAFYWVEPVTP